MLNAKELEQALHDAATSLETISQLAGRKSCGHPPIETHMDTFMDVRMYAASRAKVAREALSIKKFKCAQCSDSGKVRFGWVTPTGQHNNIETPCSCTHGVLGTFNDQGENHG